MRWCLLGFLIVAAACSRRQSAEEAYSEAWDAFRQGKLDQAQKLVDDALKNRKEQQASLRLLQSEILLAQGRAREALGLLSGLPDPPDPLTHLRWLVDRADAFSKQTQIAKALEILDEVDRTSGSNAGSEPVFRARLLRGAILAREGRFDEAEQLLQQIAASAAETGDTYDQAAALLNLSFSKFTRRRYDESVSYSRPALDAAGKAHAYRIEALANNNLGMAYTVFHDLSRAEEYQNKAIGQLREIGDLRNLEDALGELGNAHLLAHEPARAAKDFEQAVEIAKSIDASADSVRWAGRLAMAFIELQNWKEAESWNQQAYALHERLNDPDPPRYLELNSAAIASGRGNSQEATRLYRELISESRGDPYLEWNAHLRLGSLYAKERNFEQANAEYESGLALIEQVRSRFLADDTRLTYHDLQMEFFRDYVDLLVTERHEERALQVAEYSRARVLADRLQPGPKSRMISQVSPANFQRYAGQNGEVLLSYWLAPQRSFVWVVKSDGIRMKILPAENEIGDLVRTYRRTIEEDLRDPVADSLPQGERLSKMLLGPIQGELAGARKVVIVPDGELHTLNLETLPVVGAGRYWIEDVEISIAPSLNLLPDAPPISRSKPSLLLIGAAEQASPDYPDLPAAKAEIDEIQNRFRGNDEDVRTGPKATRQSFLNSNPGRFAMIHFAAHAEVNPQSPLESAVILSRDGYNYKLYARDITDLTLSADLVTMSACRSAGARAYGGEGLVGFAWAFLQSGAHAVIAGLWEVSDSSSSRLMEKLYDGLASGMTPAASLRQSKLALLRSTGAFRKPFYWAPYQTYIR